jgi:hypothetical protein
VPRTMAPRSDCASFSSVCSLAISVYLALMIERRSPRAMAGLSVAHIRESNARALLSSARSRAIRASFALIVTRSSLAVRLRLTDTRPLWRFMVSPDNGARSEPEVESPQYRCFARTGIAQREPALGYGRLRWGARASLDEEESPAPNPRG